MPSEPLVKVGESGAGGTKWKTGVYLQRKKTSNLHVYATARPDGDAYLYRHSAASEIAPDKGA